MNNAKSKTHHMIEVNGLPTITGGSVSGGDRS